jgi:hypothetical protein
MDRSSSIRQHHAAGAHPGARRSRLSIDLRAHGPALEALAQSRRMRLATLVRMALAEWLASRAAGGDGAAVDASLDAPVLGLQNGDLAKVTLRLPAASAARLAREARAAETSQGIYVAQLLEGATPMPASADLKETRRALLSSTATLAALSSDLRALERSLSKARWVDLAACRAVIDPLPSALSRHLALASSALTALTPSRRSSSRGPGSA